MLNIRRLPINWSPNYPAQFQNGSTNDIIIAFKKLHMSLFLIYVVDVRKVTEFNLTIIVVEVRKVTTFNFNLFMVDVRKVTKFITAIFCGGRR